MLTEELFIWLIRKQLNQFLMKKKSATVLMIVSMIVSLMKYAMYILVKMCDSIYYSWISILLVHVNNALPTSCTVVKSSEISQIIYNNYTSDQYTIHYTEKWCELFLSTLSHTGVAFYINLLPCPLSFVLYPVEA